MKTMYALYDNLDNFICTGFSLSEVGVSIQSFNTYNKRIKKFKLYKIPILPQKDIFEQEDEIFLKEFEHELYTKKEIAKQSGCSTRTLYRRLRKEKLKNGRIK